MGLSEWKFVLPSNFTGGPNKVAGECITGNEKCIHVGGFIVIFVCIIKGCMKPEHD